MQGMLDTAVSPVSANPPTLLICVNWTDGDIGLAVGDGKKIMAALQSALVVARCGRGGRGEPGGRYFVIGSTAQHAIHDRAPHALEEVGYRGFGDVTVISDGAEILKRLPRVMPKPTTHIIDWFHIAMKIQPMQQIADHIARSRCRSGEALSTRTVKWRLWHGRVDRAIRDLERLLARLKVKGSQQDASSRSCGCIASACNS